MSCQAAWNKTVNNETAESFTALVYAAIIDLDLDGLMPQTVNKWYVSLTEKRTSILIISLFVGEKFSHTTYEM